MIGKYGFYTSGNGLIFSYLRTSETLERLVKNIDYYVWCQNLEMTEEEKEECEDYIIAKKEILEDIEDIIGDLESFDLGPLEGNKYCGYINCPVIDIYSNKFSFNHPNAKEDDFVKECRAVVNEWHRD